MRRTESTTWTPSADRAHKRLRTRWMGAVLYARRVFRADGSQPVLTYTEPAVCTSYERPSEPLGQGMVTLLRPCGLELRLPVAKAENVFSFQFFAPDVELDAACPWDHVPTRIRSELLRRWLQLNPGGATILVAEPHGPPMPDLVDVVDELDRTGAER